MQSSVINKIKTAPKKPGVYIFYGRNREALYVGKAADLRTRLKNYLPHRQTNLKTDDYKTKLLWEETRDIKLIVLRSEIEALLEESKLIKKLEPKYNILWRDDKSYFYVYFTNDEFSKIFITHNLKAYNLQLKANLIGPFTDGRSLRTALHLLRRKFPYCTCKTLHLRQCLNAEIGNCMGFCCKKDAGPLLREIKKYKKNIRIIKNFLLGKKITFSASAEEQKAIDNILAHRHYLTQNPIPHTPNPYRAECYDISHLSGKEAVGAMTAWLNGVAEKSMWRKFKIKTAKPGDDPGAIYEVLTRRLNHPEWPYPDLIIIDGGTAQLNAAKLATNNKRQATRNIKVISFAKPGQLVLGWKEKTTPLQNMPPDLQKLIPRAIAETHRFAISYHRKVRSKELIH